MRVATRFMKTAGAFLGIALLSAGLVVPAGAAVVFQQATTAMTGAPNGNAATSLTIPKPAGVAAGDFLLAQITFEKGSDAGTNAQLTPTGWTLERRTDRGTDLGQAIFYKFATATDAASGTSSYTFPFNQAVKAAGAVMRYTGVHTTNPIVKSSGNTGDSNPLTATSVNGVPDSMLIALFGVKKQTTLTVPGGMTSRVDFANPQDVKIRAADELLTAGGDTGNRTSNAGAVDKWVAQLVALRQGAPATPTNTAPAYTPAVNQTADEGVAKSFDLGSFTDPNTHASWAVTVNWGDGSAETVFNVTATGSLGTRSHTYATAGNKTVTVTVSDGIATGSGSFSVAVNSAPVVVIQNKPSSPVEGNTTGGATVAWGPVVVSDAQDDPDPVATCRFGLDTVTSGAFFALGGPYTVICTATDAGGLQGTDSFTFSVVDTTAPVVTPPINVVMEASGPAGAVVSYSGESAVDIVSGTVSASCLPASGGTFALGTTTVTCSATDGSGNSGSATFTITVRDTTAPTLLLPNPVVEATGSSGAAVTYTASASDLVSGTVTVTCSPASGSTFPIGTTTVACSATDGAGNTANGSFTVTVQDTTPPALTLPSDITAEATGPSGAPVSYITSASDLVSGTVTVTCSPASGSTFPIGTTTVACSATDGAGNTANGSFSVRVIYGWSGFFRPVDNLPTINTVKAGSSVPLKFSLSGNHGLDIMASGYPISQRIACDASASFDGIEETVTAGGSSLSYDPAADQYVYVWKTDKAWAGTCRQVIVMLNDGTVHRANFKLMK
jgi:hypothetical protein